MEEIWKDIDGYEGLYQVSNLGNIKHLEQKRYNPLTKTYSVYTERPIKQRLSRRYMCVSLCKDTEKHTHRVHRLVAKAFISNPNNLPIINHKDENPLNNVYTNLEWCDIKYNTNYGTCLQRRALKRCVKVRCVETGVIYNSIKEASQKIINRSNSHIGAACSGKLQTAYGYHWEYIKEDTTNGN